MSHQLRLGASVSHALCSSRPPLASRHQWPLYRCPLAAISRLGLKRRVRGAGHCVRQALVDRQALEREESSCTLCHCASALGAQAKQLLFEHFQPKRLQIANRCRGFSVRRQRARAGAVNVQATLGFSNKLGLYGHGAQAGKQGQLLGVGCQRVAQLRVRRVAGQGLEVSQAVCFGLAAEEDVHRVVTGTRTATAHARTA